jgi:hypothetical protein
MWANIAFRNWHKWKKLDFVWKKQSISKFNIFIKFPSVIHVLGNDIPTNIVTYDENTITPVLANTFNNRFYEHTMLAFEDHRTCQIVNASTFIRYIYVWNLQFFRGYHTLQGDNSLKSVERFDHMMFVCRFQASRWVEALTIWHVLWSSNASIVCS